LLRVIYYYYTTSLQNRKNNNKKKRRIFENEILENQIAIDNKKKLKKLKKPGV